MACRPWGCPQCVLRNIGIVCEECRAYRREIVLLTRAVASIPSCRAIALHAARTVAIDSTRHAPWHAQRRVVRIVAIQRAVAGVPGIRPCHHERDQIRRGVRVAKPRKHTHPHAARASCTCTATAATGRGAGASGQVRRGQTTRPRPSAAPSARYGSHSALLRSRRFASILLCVLGLRRLNRRIFN